MYNTSYKTWYPTSTPSQPSLLPPYPPSNPLLVPSTNFFASPIALSLIFSISLSALLESSGPTCFPNSIALNLFFSAPLASLNATSASSPFFDASVFAASRDSCVVGGIGTRIVRGSAGEVVGLRFSEEEARAERMGLMCCIINRG